MKRIIFLVVFVSIVTGCTDGLRKFAYNNLLIQFTMSRIDDFFDLNDEQEAFLKGRLRVHHRWHRKTQLKLYAGDLADLRSRIEKGLNEADLKWLNQRVKRHRNAIYRRLIPDSAKFLSTLSQSQVDHMNEAGREKNQEIEEKLREPRNKRYSRSLEKIYDNLEDFVGSLSSSQKAAIRRDFLAMPDSSHQWLNYRKDALKTFTAFLKSKPTETQIRAELTQRLLKFEYNLSKKHQRRFTHSMKRIRTMILSIDRQLTADQRLRLVERTGEYITMIKELEREA